MIQFRWAVLLAAPALFAQPPASNPQDAIKKQLEYTRAHYTKFEYRIPMRDGAKLFTIVYSPKDTTTQYPMLMVRTPYSIGPYGVDNYRPTLGSEALAKEGFIFVYQDVRGRYMSEGTFIDIPPHKTHFNGPTDTDESTDSYDTIDWLVKNVRNNNGRVGVYGISYPGFFAAYTLMNSHPALKAVSPQAPMADVGNGDDAYHNGAFHLAANFGFYSSFKPRIGEPARPGQFSRFDYGTPDQYDFFLRMGPLSNANEKYLKNESSYWNDILKHPNYDEFWQSRAQSPHMKNVTPAVLLVGGWFDAEDLAGPVKLFRAIEENGPKAANTLIMGPWSHGGWSRGPGKTLGDLDFASNTGEFFREKIELAFFVQNLKGKGTGLQNPPDNKIPKAWLFETGTNEWQRFETWPPKNAAVRSLYFGAGGKLSFTADGAAGNDEYVSDPARPVPVQSGIGAGMPGDYMTYDQRFASTPSRRAGVSDRAAGARCDYRRTDNSGVERLHLRHGFGLRSEADRCLSRRFSGARSEPHPRAHGRLRTTGARSAVPREVPQQPVEAGTVRPQSAGQDRIHHARRLPHVPHRTPDHGAGAEFVVPTGGPQSAAIFEHPYGEGLRFREGHRAGVSRRGEWIRSSGVHGGVAGHAGTVQLSKINRRLLTISRRSGPHCPSHACIQGRPDSLCHSRRAGVIASDSGAVYRVDSV